jgi:hypothetical protein
LKNKGGSLSVYDTLRKINPNEDTLVTLTYSEGTDVFVHNETEVETALSETSVIDSFCELIATPGLRASDRWGNSVLEQFRDNDLLEEYERDFTFAEFLGETVRENFYDLELIDHSTEKYDYKRGFCTLTATVQVPVDNLLKSAPFLHGWEVTVTTEMGQITLNH